MPRLRRHSTCYWWGYPEIPCAPYWTCDDDKASGLGKTPKEAYADWEKSIPKTLLQRFINWIF